MVDPGFGVNAFNKPKMLNESQTFATNILTLLFGRPGFYPSIPWLGIGIQDIMYKFFDSIDPDVLKAKISYQCNYYTQAIRDGDLDIVKTLYKGSPMLLITIPVTIQQSNLRLAIGISTNSKGEMIYNFQYQDE